MSFLFGNSGLLRGRRSGSPPGEAQEPGGVGAARRAGKRVSKLALKTFKDLQPYLSMGERGEFPPHTWPKNHPPPGGKLM